VVGPGGRPALTVVSVWMANCVRAGLDCHADLLGDGRPALTVVSVWMANCVRAGLDCHADLLGDGRRLV